MVIARSVLDLIGNTPLLDLSDLVDGRGRLFAKAEFLNPGGSIKDRSALSVIRAAREQGLLAPGQTVVEMTSGNMGAGLALVCGQFGHRLFAVMSQGNSRARADLMRAFGAEVVLVPQRNGGPGRVTSDDIEAANSVAREIAARQNAFFVDQFNNPASIAAHSEGTGPEILRDLERVDAFVSAVGTGGTFVGVATALKRRDPTTHCVAVEPVGAEVLAGKPLLRAQHMLQGTSYGIVPPHWRHELMDAAVAVSDDEVIAWRLRLGQAGLHVGFSSAANICAAERLLRQGGACRGATIVTLLADTGFKYLD